MCFHSCTSLVQHLQYMPENIPRTAGRGAAMLQQGNKMGIPDTVSHRMGIRNIKPAENGALTPTLFSGPSRRPKQGTNRAF